jgi:predicted trehalose synthase
VAISSDLERLLSSWLPRQDWFPLPRGLGSDPDVTPMSTTRLFEFEVEDQIIQGLQVIVSVSLETTGRTLLGAPQGPATRRLSLPLTLHTTENFPLRPHLLGRVEDLVLGHVWVYDGTADPVFVQAVAASLHTGRKWDDGQVLAQPVRRGALLVAQQQAAMLPTSSPAGSASAGESIDAQASGTAHAPAPAALAGAAGGPDAAAAPGQWDAGAPAPADSADPSTSAADADAISSEVPIPTALRADLADDPADSVLPDPATTGGQGLAGAAAGAGRSAAQIMADAQTVQLSPLDAQPYETSVVIADPAQPAILTFYRALDEGLGGNVQVPLILTRRGCEAVSPVLGWLSGRWFDGEDLRTESAPLAMLTATERGARPAWREAVDVASRVDSGAIGSWNRQATALGRRVGALHLDLAHEFDVLKSEGEPTLELVSKWKDRIDWALARAPLALGDLGRALRTHKKQLDSVSSVGPLQRIHGALTLNQVSSGRTTGFTVGSFPAKGSEKLQPASVDLVGLLRSIDYAAGYARLNRTGRLEQGALPTGLSLRGLKQSRKEVEEVLESPEHLWSSQAQNALLSGYSHVVGAGLGYDDPTLRAVLIDRLLVEVVTELRNRPPYLSVPLIALAQVLQG